MRDLAPALDDLGAFAADAARRAGQASLNWFRVPLTIDTKADESPVTVADRTVESLLRAEIVERFPDHGIFGEEHGRERMEAEHVWVIDPIDGTRSFITGWPLYGTLLAVLRQDKPVIGVIEMPALGERWVGIAGQPTRFQGAPCRTSDCRELAAASLYTTSPDAFDPAGWAVFDRVSRQVRTRRFGGDCYSYGLLAAGHIDLVIEAGLQPYDYLSLVPILEGAGGAIADWQGRPLTTQSDGRVVAAASPELLAAALAAIAAAQEG